MMQVTDDYGLNIRLKKIIYTCIFIYYFYWTIKRYMMLRMPRPNDASGVKDQGTIDQQPYWSCLNDSCFSPLFNGSVNHSPSTSSTTHCG